MKRWEEVGFGDSCLAEVQLALMAIPWGIPELLQSFVVEAEPTATADCYTSSVIAWKCRIDSLVGGAWWRLCLSLE